MTEPGHLRNVIANTLADERRGRAAIRPDAADELSPTEFKRILTAHRTGENVRDIIAEGRESAPQRRALNDEIRRQAGVIPSEVEPPKDPAEALRQMAAGGD